MITKDNFKKLLLHLKFEKKGEVFTKHFGGLSAVLQADFKAQKLIYPESDGLVIHNRTICNFSSNENFVVFECVHRLFEKGYKPEHIELEPKFPSGHGSNGGRADILVNDNTKKSLLIIQYSGNFFTRIPMRLVFFSGIQNS